VYHSYYFNDLDATGIKAGMTLQTFHLDKDDKASAINCKQFVTMLNYVLFCGKYPAIMFLCGVKMDQENDKSGLLEKRCVTEDTC
jgi:hypothetical protein